MSTYVNDARGLTAGDASALIATQRKLSTIIRLLTYDHQSALLSLGDLQGDALRIIEDYSEQIGEILELSQNNPHLG